MSDVEYLIGSETISDRPMRTFSDEICAFLEAFSKRLMKSPEGRAYPDLSTLAFWCRKGNIQQLRQNYGDLSDRLGRGLCFHVAPSNIPINFAFSFFFSLLAGNANIVRLPSRDFPQIAPVLTVLAKVLAEFDEIARRTALIRYRADNEITARFSAMADARVIWGGDITVESIKKLSTRPRCLDITFADRYSISILNGAAVLAADTLTLQRLSENFYNDTWLMDQNACSSPQLILWINDSNAARKRFWDVVYETAAKRYSLQATTAVDKLVHFCEDALHSDIIKEGTRRGNLLYRTELKSIRLGMESYRGKGGYFYEYSLDNLAELGAIVTDKFQTVTYFGLDPLTIRDAVITGCWRGMDRIVPIGNAMEIGPVWDGTDLISTLSRRVALV